MNKLNETQREVIDFRCGSALVMSTYDSPKTDIPAQRILKANKEFGVPYSDMLCVTYTNGEAQDLKQQIFSALKAYPEGLFIGSIYQFCLEFLYRNHVIDFDTSVIDESDQETLIRALWLPKKPKVEDIRGVIWFSNALREEGYKIPHIYWSYHARAKSRYRESARQYLEYLEENNLMDFDDVFFRTYIALSRGDVGIRIINNSYKWIQAEGVENFSALQFAILDLLSGTDCTVVYFGVEPEPNNSFLGSRYNYTIHIEDKCKDNVFHLSKESRMAEHIAELLKDYATGFLNTGYGNFLNRAKTFLTNDALTGIPCNYDVSPYPMLAALVRRVSFDYPEETVGILTADEKEVAKISKTLAQHKIRHIRPTETEAIKTNALTTIYSHFSVVLHDGCSADWGHILHQTNVMAKLTDAFRCIKKMRELALSPRDLLEYESSSFIMEFCKAYSQKDIVVFNIKTQGSGQGDGISEIAACKLRRGEFVEGSVVKFLVKPVGNDNGIYRALDADDEFEYRKNEDRNILYFANAKELMEGFLKYVGDADLVSYRFSDLIRDLESKVLSRKQQGVEVQRFWDTFLICRLLNPGLRFEGLKALTEALALDPIDFDDKMGDFIATVRIAKYCYDEGLTKVEAQKAFLSHKAIKAIQDRLQENYWFLFNHTKNRLFAGGDSSKKGMANEFKYVYEYMLSKGYISEIPRFEEIFLKFNESLALDGCENFRKEVDRHIFELKAYGMGALYQNEVLKDKIRVMTINEAKGQVFDNVFLLENGNNRPYVSLRLFSVTGDQSAKTFFLGMSRARKRLYIFMNGQVSTLIGNLRTIKEHCYFMPQKQVDMLLKMEELFVKPGQ